MAFLKRANGWHCLQPQDVDFYKWPRLVTHIDDKAIGALEKSVFDSVERARSHARH